MSKAEPTSPAGASARRLAVLAWGLLALAMLGLAVVGWIDHLLRQAGRADLTQLNAGGVPFAVAILSASATGTLVARRRHRHPVGWLLLLLGLTASASGVLDGYVGYGLLARPEALPATSHLAVYSPAAFVASLACVGFVLLLTPTGSLPSPRWRRWARITAAAPAVFLVAVALQPEPLDPIYQSVANPLGVPALGGPLAVVDVLASAVTVAGVVAAAVSLAVRFRRGQGVERQQLKWVAMAAGVVAVAVVVVLAGMLTGAPGLIGAAAGGLAILPLAIGAAILRYRLYDLDRIVSRTIAYGLLTVLLGAGYAVVVLGLGQVLGPLLGRGSAASLAVAGATLAVAAAFQPARRRVQDLVDRRFNRRRYDAERTIAAFSGRLRQQTDLDALTTELLSVVDQTMRPTRAALWLRPAAASGRGSARVRG